MAQFTLRTTDNAALTRKDIEVFAPAVYAKGPSPRVGGQYTFVPTYEVIDLMAEEGYVPTQVSRVHNPRSKRVTQEHSQHMVRFARKDMLKPSKLGDSVPEIVVLNSHDGSKRFSMFGGLMRLVCLNGLVVTDASTFEPITVRHTAQPIMDVMLAFGDLVKRHDEIGDRVKQLQGTKWTEDRQRAFARDALALLGERRAAIDPAALLAARRTGDNGDTAWHVFNRVQENIVRGNVEGVTADNRRTVTRGIGNLSREIDVNAGLWLLAMQAIGRAAATSAAQVAAEATVTA